MAEGDVVLPLCRTIPCLRYDFILGLCCVAIPGLRCVVIPGLTGYLDSRSGSGMTVVMCNVLLAVATREWLLGFVP